MSKLQKSPLVCLRKDFTKFQSLAILYHVDSIKSLLQNGERSGSVVECLAPDLRAAGVTIQNGWNNRISYGCVYAQIRSGLGMHLVTYSNHDTVLFLLIVPIKGRFV